MRFWVFLLIPLIPLFSNETLTAVTENDPSTLVDGVSVITGDFYAGEEDYSVAGAEPIPIRRFYLSALGGINQYPHLTAAFALFLNELMVHEPNGTLVTYRPDPTNRPRKSIGDEFYDKKKLPLKYHSVDFANASLGVTNTSTGTISAKSHLKNQTIVFDPGVDKKGKSFSLYASDGTIRRYINFEHQEKADFGPYGKERTLYAYKLVSETLPNGRILHYEWDGKNRLLSMRTSNPDNTKTFAKVYLPKIDPKGNPFSHTLWGSDGRSLSYLYRPTGKKSAAFAQVVSPQQADQFFDYADHRLSQISLPQGRTLVIQYEGSQVVALLAPVGPNGSLIPYHRFSYDVGAKTSRCTDALGNVACYSWNSDARLTRIDRYEGEQTHRSSETFVWKGTHLRCKVFYDAEHHPLFAKTFAYDAKGNVLEEIFWGNISGRGPPLHIDTHEMPLDDGVEKAITKSSYDGRNLLTRREDCSGLVTEYTYLSHAELPTMKRLSASGKVVSKTTYEYDKDNTLIREVTVDGSSVCKIQEIHPRQSDPYIGLPEWILEKYIENGQETVLKKTVLHYTSGALVSQKDVFDAKGAFQYALHYQYDAKGRILEETNALRQVSSFRYDEVGNKIASKEFSGRTEIFDSYDAANRLTKKVQEGFDGIKQISSYTYDAKHNLISETDPYGNTTFYEYDWNGHKTKTTLPSQRTFDGNLQIPITTVRYDSLGNPISQIDAQDHETKRVFNVLGKPTRIVHPDGAIEENVYNLDGTLALHIDPLGIETRYTYDALGHLLEKRTEDAVETFVYDGTLLVGKTDAEGITTAYRYDGAGRKISESVAGETVEFRYDPLGRLAARIEGELLSTFRYDLLDRLLEEKKTDPSGTVLQLTRYEYDSAGNQIAVIQGVESEERFEYDSLNRQVRRTDPLGFFEVTQYLVVPNDLGQNVLQKVVTDPLGLQTIETFDAQHRLFQLEKRKGETLLSENFYYDLNGQKIAQEEHLYNPDRTIVNRWEYDARGRFKTLIEGNGAKTTRYEYNLRGEKTAEIKPDGTTLFYEHNHLGHLIHLFSSDRTVDHLIQVDRLGRWIGFDGIVRKLDPVGRILEEQFPNKVAIQNRYDSRGRKIECFIPHFGLTVGYQYGPLHLEEVHFQNHTHAYSEYDLAGNVVQENPIGGLSSFSRCYDKVLRPTSLQAPCFTQQIQEYDTKGNILCMAVDQEQQTYTYDALYQLTAEQGFFRHTYVCDALYNRLLKDEEVYTPNALNQIPSHATYDPNGNPLQIGLLKLFYDALNRLTRVETSDAVQTFTYDALNRCLSRTELGKEPLFFLYDGQNEIGSYDCDLRDFRALGRTEAAEIGSAVAVLLDHELYAPIHDLQGNLAVLISLQEGKVSKYRYGAFGEEKIEGLKISPWRFSSKRTDPVTGFVNYGRRDYVPLLGRWLTPDPLGLTAGANLYAFLQNDPLIHLDEYGLLALPLVYKPWQEPSEATKRFGIATAHEIGKQTLDIGRFVTSTPYHVERGYNYLTGRETNTFAGWHERQNQFFNTAEDWMYRAIPTDMAHPDYLRYRRGIGLGLDIGTLAFGGYGLAKGGIKAAKWGVNAWKLKRGTYIAAQNLGASARGGGWMLPKEGGGALINGRWYAEHALERMAPRTPQVMTELENRFLARAKVTSQKLHPKEFHKWCLENAPNPRGIPPSVVEAEIAQPGSTGVRVILNEKGHVITVIPGD